MHPSGTPASKDELVINEKIFGACNHTDWHEFRNKYESRVLACTQCGEEFEYSSGFFGDEAPSLPPAEFLKSAIRKYSQEEVLANLILRTVEAGGWVPLVRHDGGIYTCVLTRGHLQFVSKSHPTRTAAVCEAAASLARSGLFQLPPTA